MNFQGDFEGLTLASILQLLCNDQKTGVLTVTCDDNESRIFFEKGTIVYASGSLKSSSLGFFIRADGLVSSQQLQVCLTGAREKNLHLGKVLVDKGFLSPAKVEKYITRQAETILYHLFFWKKGRFEYKDARLNLKGMIVTQLNPMKLILEASRRIDELSVLKKVISSDKIVFKLSGKVQKKQDIKFNANEWRIFSLIDGTLTVQQIIDKSGYDEFAAYTFFFSMISSGLIVQNKDVQPDNTPVENDYSGILTVFNDILASIKKNIVDELGDRSNFLFEEIKSSLAIEVNEVLRDYHPDNQERLNLSAITRALDRLEFVEDPRDFLITGFSEYCAGVLEKVGEILGAHPLVKILDDIEKILGYVKKHQTGLKEKNKIITAMKTVRKKIYYKYKINKKQGSRGGILSLFSR